MNSKNETSDREKVKQDIIISISKQADDFFSKQEWENALNSYNALLKHHANEIIIERLAVCHFNLESYYESIVMFNIILKNNPRHISSIQNVAKIYYQLNQFENAAVYLHKLVLLEPLNIIYNFELGKAYFDRGWFPEAINSLGKAVSLIDKTIKNNNEYTTLVINIYNLIGNAYLKLDCLLEAEYHFKKAYEINQFESEINFKLAETLFKSKKYYESTEYYKKNLRLNIDDNKKYYIYKKLVECFLKLENLDEMLLYASKFKSNSNTPEKENEYNNLMGIYYYSVYNMKQALEYFDKCEKTYNIYFLIGGCYYLLHDYNNAKINLEKSYELNKDSKETIQALCYNELKFKKFEKGFEWNEVRFFCYAHKYTLPESLPDWDLKAECKKLLVSGEQGIGDVIQFNRYLIDLAQMYPDIQITYLLDNKLHNLINLDFLPNVEILTNIPDFSIYDFKLYLFSIPYLLKVRHISPYSGPNYIQTNLEITNKWKKTLDAEFPDKKPIIALFWSGFTTQFIEKTIKLDEFKEIGELDIHLISVQKGSGEEEIFTSETNITSFDNFDNGPAFEDTIGILQNVDLLITIDTSVAHIAGLLGIKTWMILGDVYDWRWFRNERKTDWYESVELFRAKKPRNWTPVLKEIRGRLETEFNLSKKTDIPEIPISIGELFDKYSILEIKREKITNPEKLSRVNNELDKLKPITERFEISPILYYDLIKVNRELWDIEDRIRVLEKAHDFSGEFIKLARSVYFKNDLRGEIKSKINKYFNSDICEVKDYKDYKK